MNEWFNGIITRMFHLMHAVERDNFDAERYVDISPTAVFVLDHAFYFIFLEAHRAEFFKARAILADEASRGLFDQLILFRLLGHNRVRLSPANGVTRDYRAPIDQWRVEQTSEAGLLGPLHIFAVPVGDDVLCFKCWHGNVAAWLLFHQYYFDRNGIRIAPERGDHALDVGSCFGDTAIGFAHSVGETGRVYGFDPMPKHCTIIRESMAMNPTLADRITLFDFGLSDRIQVGGAMRQDIDPGARVSGDLPTRTLDSLELARVDFIKMDIEGSELAALKGGEQTIRRCKPKLAISLYHQYEDFFAIPFWIDSLGLGYRFYLDHYSIHQEETVLYAMG